MSDPEETLKTALKRSAVRTIDAAVARMELIDRALPTRDGVAWFNKLYLKTTQNVLAAIDTDSFRYPRFMERLDVVFANLYFQALRESLYRPARIPKAWAPLFTERARRGIAPIQFALAGMNAHINRDLAVAVVKTCQELDVRPDGRHKRDYDLINPVLLASQEEVKAWFATGFAGVVDEAFGQTDDVVANWSISRARDAGWVNSRLLWEIRNLGPLKTAFVRNLDHTVGFAGRGLLIPTIRI